MPKKFKSNKRNTLQKTFIETMLRDSQHPLSVADILLLAKDAGVPVGRVTVFRFLKKNLIAGAIRKVQGPNGEVLYDWGNADSTHQHHFFCRACEEAFPVEGCGLRLAGFELPKGFSVERHEVQLVGLCDECQAA